MSTDDVDPKKYMGVIMVEVKRLMEKKMVDWRGIKAYIGMKMVFVKDMDAEKIITPTFSAKIKRIVATADIDDQLAKIAAEVWANMDTFVRRGSGWVVRSVEHVDIHLGRYKPLYGATYKALPKALQAKKAIVNVKNTDKKCFMWAVLSALHPCASIHPDHELLKIQR